MTTQSEIEASFLIRSFIHNNTSSEQTQPRAPEAQRNPAEVETALLLVKNLFELREFKKCIHLLKDYRARFPDNQSVIFYYYYCIWMNGLIRKEEEIYENGTPCLTQRTPTGPPPTPTSSCWTGSSGNCTRSVASTGSTCTCTGWCCGRKSASPKPGRSSWSPSTPSPTSGPAGSSCAASSNPRT